MGMPNGPLTTLSVEQVSELNHKLASMRHDINNYMTVMMSAAELTRSKPDLAARLMPALLEQVPRVIDAVKAFSVEFEQAFGISKP